jgi:hypothetical protein
VDHDSPFVMAGRPSQFRLDAAQDFEPENLEDIERPLAMADSLERLSYEHEPV